MPQRGRSHGLTLGTPVDLGQRQRSFNAHAMFSRTGAATITFQFRKHEERDPPCIRGSVFRSSQRLLPGLLLAPCWGLQVSLSIQRQPRRSYIASTLNIRPVAWRGPASCSGLVRWRALRSVITPVAMQMVASIALGCGGKGLFRGSRARKKPSPLRPGGGFFIVPTRQATDSGQHHVIAFTSRRRQSCA